jgi:hypothetical protein
MFEEALYGVGPTRVGLLHAREKLERVLMTLTALSPLWEMVRAADLGDVRIVDRYYRFDLALISSHVAATMNGPHAISPLVACYAAPDLIVRPSARAPTRIVDFKCGRADGVVDAVMTYTLAAEEGLHLTSQAGWVGAVAALDEAGDAQWKSWFEFSVTPTDLADARARITHKGQSRCAAVLRGGGPGVLGPTPACRGCALCVFRRR